MKANLSMDVSSAVVAQLVERLIRNQEVGCSIHPSGTNTGKGYRDFREIKISLNIKNVPVNVP